MRRDYELRDEARRTKNMFYLIRERYVGPGVNTPEHHMDREGTMTIQTMPGRTNQSSEERTDGWLGTTNDWDRRAYGEYNTLETARGAAANHGYTELVDEPEPGLIDGENIIEVYTTEEGIMEPWTVDSWLAEADTAITAETTDEEIEQLAKDLDLEAYAEGVYLYGDIEAYLRKQRDELKRQED